MGFTKRFPDLRLNMAFNCAMLALLGIVVGLTSLLLGADAGLTTMQSGSRTFGLQMFLSYFTSPGIMILNLLPPVVLIFFLYFALGRAWIAFVLTSLITLSLSVVHFFKLQIRGDPFVAADIVFIREAGMLVSSYSPTMGWEVYIAIAVFACGAAFSVFILKCKVSKLPVRAICGAVAVAVSVLLYTTVYTDTRVYAAVAGGSAAAQDSSSLSYASKGFIYPFIYGIRYAQPAATLVVEGYDEYEVRLLLDSFVDIEVPADTDRSVNIITIMLESYADFSAFGVIEFEEDVFGPLHRLQAESISGTLITNIFRGNTIDTERLFLTGFTRLTEYSSDVNSFVRYLNARGYHTEGFTAAEGWFYDRRSVNQYLGFAGYFFLEDYPDGNQSDEFFFSTVMELYNGRDRDKPYFSFNLSAQNHGPYPDSFAREPHMIKQGGMSIEAFNILNNYLHGIQDTTLRVERFIDGLRNDPDPVVVLVCGDHLPWLGNSNLAYMELGINIDWRTEEGLLNCFSTPYFIWANDAAKAVLESDFVGDGGSFSPFLLMGELFSYSGLEGDGYMRFLREFKAHVDVIQRRALLFRENGVFTSELSPEVDAMFQTLRWMEHYRLHSYNTDG
jgi:phosphoglycerol transferase MdoB-like AlkP superfamily enzyme